MISKSLFVMASISTVPLALAMIPLSLLSLHSPFNENHILSHRRTKLKSNYFEKVVNSLRGGSDSNDGNNNNNPMGKNSPEMMQASYQEQIQEQPGTPPQPTATAGGEFVDVMGAFSDPMYYGYRETVEDRIDAWRRQQQHMRETQSAADAASAVDEQGRFKLFTTVSKVSVSFFFFILMWRTVHHYELADATFGPSGRRSSSGGFRAALVRTIVLSPLVVLFLGEMMGAILGLSGGAAGGGQSHATKKRLKGILNLHKGVELVMMVYNIARLAIFPSKYTIREVYIGRTISNFFFLLQCNLYTKLSWDDVSKSTVGDGYTYESYYDDYTPETENEYSSWPRSENGNDSDQYNEYYQQNENNVYTTEDQQNQQYYPQQ